MPTLLSHPAVPLALGLGLGRGKVPGALLAAGVAASMLPDADVAAFRLGIPYAAALGHRGFSHSLLVAVAAAGLGAWLLRRRVPGRVAFPFLFLAMASHGLLDACTTGGLGIALLWPFSAQRCFAPVRMIRVSPIGLSRFVSRNGLAVLASEAAWIWLPCALAAGVLAWRRTRVSS